VAPVTSGIALSATEISEGDMVTLSGDFVDPGSLSSHTVTIDWGDGTAPTVQSLSVGHRSFAIPYEYLDDNPTGTPADINTINVTITDNDGLSDMDSTNITVNNVDPVIVDFESNATFETKAAEGEPVNILANFTDVGILDTHTAEVDWGDGTVEPATVTPGAPGAGTVTGSHPYTNGGIYTITVTLIDDDTGTSAPAETTAVVTGVGLTDDGILYIIGSAENDEVSVNRTGNGTLKVKATFIPEDYRGFDVAAVDKIISYLCQGDDELAISSNVTIPAIIHGSWGNDHLNAGGGPTVLDGGPGDDVLIGQGGRNILIGGEGWDRLVGGRKDDVLIGSSTTSDDDDDALMALAIVWNDEDDSYDDRVLAVDSLLTVIDDGNVDTLTGSSGEDLFYDGVGVADMLTDVHLKKGEIVLS
jgi:hypothetical protein